MKKKEIFVKNLFSSIAGDYDRVNKIISLFQHEKIKHKAINLVSIPQNAKVIDVCTGTGDMAIYLAKERPDLEVVGIDFCEDMLEEAKKKAEGLSNVEFMVANALKMPFEDNSFDTVFISFGLRNLDGLDKGIVELKRVLKTGGCVVSLEAMRPQGLLSPFIELYFYKLLPFIAKLAHREVYQYEYLASSIKSFCTSDELSQRFITLGFRQVLVKRFMFGAIAAHIAMK